MKKLSLLSLVLITFFACRKNVENDLTTTTRITPPIITEIDYEPEVIEVVATLFGEVYDEAGNPAANANVSLDNNNTSTDDKGRFVFKDVTMNKLGTYVEINKNGFFPGSNRFFPEAGSVNYVKITLLDQSNIGNFPADDGALISSPEGISIEFPSNSVVDANGDLYQGTVEVAARWIDPTANNVQELMPGGLQGLMAGGAQGTIGEPLEEVALASFGMMAVELEGTNGESLNLGNDKKATLTFPVPAELLSNAPASIPLWYFNETVGLWVAEGSATLQDDKYVGDVAHFSFWNCDVPFDYASVCGTVLSSSGLPLADAFVVIRVVSSGESGVGWTNGNGQFFGKVPANELLEMIIYEKWYCAELLTTTIDPLATSTDPTVCQILGPFTVTTIFQEIDITGNILACSTNPVTNGWIELTLGDNSYTYYIDNGNNVEITLFNCNNETELTALAGNIDELVVSDEMTYTITYPLDLGTISACGNTLPEWLTTTIDGSETTFPEVSFNYETSADTLILTAQVPGTNQSVQFNLINGVGGPNLYDNDDITVAWISTPSPTSGGLLTASCSVYPPAAPNPCVDFSQVEITSLGNIGQLVTGEINGTLDFYDSGISSNVTKTIDIEFSIIRD